jgi:CheY-like chemotaxis protein
VIFSPGPTGRFTKRKIQAGTGCALVNEQLIFEGEVLLCEDNKMNQDLICSRLTKAGLKITIADDGKKGVDLVRVRAYDGKKPFDLIFMDIYMPVMDGYEAAAEIVQLDTGTPIIAISANDMSAEWENCAAHGMSGFLNKPFKSQELSDCLLKYLKPRAGEPVNRSSEAAGDADTLSEERLKIKLINNFLEHNKTVCQEIAKAIDEGDIKLAHRFAHNLKSNAGMLGKTSLRKAAEDVEHLLTNEENRANESVLNILKTELDTALEELAPFAAKGAPPEEKEAAVTLGEEETRALCDELEVLLDGGSTECLNLTSRLRLLPERFGPLAGCLTHQIEYFEFDKAMETLTLLKRNIAGDTP